MPNCPYGKPLSVPKGCRKCTSFDRQTNGCMKDPGHKVKRYQRTKQAQDVTTRTVALEA